MRSVRSDPRCPPLAGCARRIGLCGTRSGPVPRSNAQAGPLDSGSAEGLGEVSRGDPSFTDRRPTTSPVPPACRRPLPPPLPAVVLQIPAIRALPLCLCNGRRAAAPAELGGWTALRGAPLSLGFTPFDSLPPRRRHPAPRSSWCQPRPPLPAAAAAAACERPWLPSKSGR